MPRASLLQNSQQHHEILALNPQCARAPLVTQSPGRQARKPQKVLKKELRQQSMCYWRGAVMAGEGLSCPSGANSKPFTEGQSGFLDRVKAKSPFHPPFGSSPWTKIRAKSKQVAGAVLRPFIAPHKDRIRIHRTQRFCPQPLQ